MNRRILIFINAGKVGADNYCGGVYKDKDNYISFFESGYGGYYSNSEIRAFDKPSKLKVREELSNLSKDNIEFSIIIFCGHGWYSTISNSNIFKINDIEQIDSLEFRKGANKRIIIEDNCREPHAEYILESITKGFSARSLSDSTQQQINPEQCKWYYNKRISECSEQLIIAMACDLGETAGDNSSTGGYYSSSLLKRTIDSAIDDLKSIDLNQSYSIYSFPTSHTGAIPLVRQRSGNTQNPQIEKPRFDDSKKYLPFSIIA